MADQAAAAAPAASAASAPSSSPPTSPASPAATSAPATTSTETTPSSSASPLTPAAASPPADKPARPDWAPESFWDADSGKVKPEFAEHYKSLATFQATEESRRLTLPKSADEYKVQLPQDFVAPPGIEFKLNDQDPIMAQARQLMHDIDTGKVSGQAAFEKMLSLHAANEVGVTQNLKTARDAEVAKLGATGTARVTSVQNFLNAQLGEADGKFMANMLVTAKHVEGFERLMAAFRNQGAGTFSPPRAPNEPARLSDEQVSKMTYSERKDYAAQFNGAQRPN